MWCKFVNSDCCRTYLKRQRFAVGSKGELMWISSSMSNLYSYLLYIIVLSNFSFSHPSLHKSYSTKAVLQLCINPDSYQVGPQTIGATSEIDPKFSNQEIEWSTKERGSIILYGLLVKLDEEN